MFARCLILFEQVLYSRTHVRSNVWSIRRRSHSHGHSHSHSHCRCRPLHL